MKNVKITQRGTNYEFEMTFEKAIQWLQMLKQFRGMKKTELKNHVNGASVMTENVIMFFPKQ